MLLGDGTRLVVLVDPLGAGSPSPSAEGPGAIRPAPGERPAAEDRDTVALTVRSTSRRVIRVSSHFPFERTNPRLEFDRSAATGRHLDIPAGASERWAPGETKEVSLIRYAGRLGREGER